MILEMAVVATGLGLLLVDLWTPPAVKRHLGYGAAAALGFILLLSFSPTIASAPASAFNGMFVQDSFALYFKRFFLVAAILTLLLTVEFADCVPSGIGEYYAILLFALAGMMFAASANDFSLLFVAIELITVCFYVLTSFQRSRVTSLEAGVKYLILGALSSAFMVFGIALVFGITGRLNFHQIAAVSPGFLANNLFLLGLLMILAGLGFKIAAFPFQMWAPDVYEGAPLPTTAFLAVGSKAAGFALLLRVLFTAVPAVATHWARLFVVLSAVTMLYGSLCAIPQRNLKRLMGYSSIANAGYLLLGVAALSQSGQSAILFYLTAYLFTVMAAFSVIGIVLRRLDKPDLDALNGLHRRSPVLAAALTVSMVSLAGVPPLAGFFGKFLLIKAVLEKGATSSMYTGLLCVTLLSVVISLYYYFGVVRAIYWPPVQLFPNAPAPSDAPIEMSLPMRYAVYACMAVIFYLGVFPGTFLAAAEQAVIALKL